MTTKTRAITPPARRQAAFIFWAADSRLHVLARTVPAARLAVATDSIEPLPGTPARVLLALATTGGPLWSPSSCSTCPRPGTAAAFSAQLPSARPHDHDQDQLTKGS